MAAPSYPPGSYASSGVNPAGEPARQLVSAARLVSLLFWILGIAWVAWSAYAAAVLSTIGFGASWAGVAYPLLFVVINLLTWNQLPHVEYEIEQKQYGAAREHLLLWGILGIIGGLVVGILLLVAYSKVDELIRWQSYPGGASGPVSTGPYPPGATVYAPPSAPVYPVSPSAPVAGGPAAGPLGSSPAAAPPAAATAYAAPQCPRCGRPATWIPQYGRWYCYPDQMYI